MGLVDRFKKESLFKKAYNLFNQERFTEALECCDRVLEIGSSQAKVWVFKGTVFEIRIV